MSTTIDIGIAEEQRKEVVHGRSQVLADSYSLYLRTHSYHWNVVGRMFHSLHAMFMDEYAELALAVDEVAERIGALGAPAHGTYREFAALSSVPQDTDRAGAWSHGRLVAPDCRHPGDRPLGTRQSAAAYTRDA
jgi:starvation-inducible DNA-binding protein